MKKEYINKRIAKGEVFDKPSKTVPGQSLSIKLAVERVRQGLPVQAVRMFYDPPGSESPMPRIKDLTDIEELESYLRSVKDKLNVTRGNKNKKPISDAGSSEANE